MIESHLFLNFTIKRRLHVPEIVSHSFCHAHLAQPSLNRNWGSSQFKHTIFYLNYCLFQEKNYQKHQDMFPSIILNYTLKNTRQLKASSWALLWHDSKLVSKQWSNLNLSLNVNLNLSLNLILKLFLKSNLNFNSNLNLNLKLNLRSKLNLKFTFEFQFKAGTMFSFLYKVVF